MFAKRIAATATALAAGATVAAVGATAPAAADAGTAGWTRVPLAATEQLAARKDCYKDLAVQHKRTGKFLVVENRQTGDLKNMIRATAAEPTAREFFELCIVGPGTEGAQVYLRSQKVRAFVQTEKFAGRLHGMLRARATALSASTDLDMAVVDTQEATFTLKSTYVDKWVTVERNYPGTVDELVRAGRDAASTGEEFVLWTLS
ncbi:MAG TPA: hypothetical protein VFY17_02410 [Pilimelia sp.]|nr:hypothetical protein [Pilimelia sp.]